MQVTFNDGIETANKCCRNNIFNNIFNNINPSSDCFNLNKNYLQITCYNQYCDTI